MSKYQTEISKKAEIILSNPKNSQKMENEIDEMVYDLYGLNKKEIEIIEKSLK